MARLAMMMTMSLALCVQGTAGAAVVYGKYFAKGGSQNCQTYYLWTPTKDKLPSGGKFPLVAEWHGGGFTGGRATAECNALCQSYLANGIAFASFDYRLVTTKYFYCPDGSTACAAPKEEEFIHAAEDGTLTADTTGMVMTGYKVKVGRQEYNTKCSFDAAAALEHVIAHANKTNIDLHRISFTGGSAGGGEIHYLTWVYHALNGNSARYTPVGMVYTMAQLDYPVQNMLDVVWQHWADDLGEDTPVSTMLAGDNKDCLTVIGNPWCDGGQGPSEVDVCNEEWNTRTMKQFCTPANFSKTTLGDLTWPPAGAASATSQDKGIATLWYNSRNMVKHQPKPAGGFFLYIANHLNSTAGMNVVHNSLYARTYAKYAETAGINYAVYYTDYEGMQPSDKAPAESRIHDGRGQVFNSLSNFHWRGMPGVAQQPVTGPSEQTLFHCHAFGLNCTLAPVPGPGPSPAPLTPACEKAIDGVCKAEEGNLQTCEQCIHSNAHDLIAAGCPPAGQGGAWTCTEYCAKK